LTQMLPIQAEKQSFLRASAQARARPNPDFASDSPSVWRGVLEARTH